MPTLLNDDFSLSTLCQGINTAPVSFGPVANESLFTQAPGTTVDIEIEKIDETLTLIQTSLRGGIGDMHPTTRRSMVKLKAPHIRTSSTILADSWQGRTGFNQKGSPANVLTERDRILGEHRRRIEATIDFHMTRALAGQVLDADGSVLVDLLAEFGVSQAMVDCGLDTGSTNVTNKLIAARRLSESELGIFTAKSWVAFADAEYMDALRAHPSIEAALAGHTAATLMIADHRSGDLVVGGIRFIEVPNRAGHTYIDAGTAYLCPEGIPQMFMTNFAPADYVDSVNETALPLYSRGHELPFNRGVMVESQANPISIVTRPRAVIKLTA
ncbi:hypothetical protein os4_21190 [Comamonadaceae bacterium OS-4]|nr:hypothetical protein os4_21190 [Comamonadaceae bacterium OS-4]